MGFASKPTEPNLTPIPLPSVSHSFSLIMIAEKTTLPFPSPSFPSPKLGIFPYHTITNTNISPPFFQYKNCSPPLTLSHLHSSFFSPNSRTKPATHLTSDAIEMLAHEETNHMMMMVKGKRTKRPRPPSPMALTMSISGDPATSSSTTTTDAAAAYTSPTPVAVSVTEEEEDMAHCLILLARGGAGKIQNPDYSPAAAAGMYVYECKTCNRCFPSFQALGGHRASHKKPKSQPEEKAAALSLITEGPQQLRQAAESGKSGGVEGVGLSLQMACNSSNTLSASNNHNDNTKSKVHACAICAAEFSSGQALGGHMRRHRSLVTVSPAPARNLQLSLDLNLPADEEEEQQSPSFMFPTKEKTLVFAGSLVDCRY